MSRTVHCHISGLLQLDSVSSSGSFLSGTASIHGVSFNVGDDFSISVTVNYYNTIREEFSSGAVVFCSGALIITESSNDHPQLSIKPHFLVSCPGDPQETTYIEQLPAMFPPTLDFTGAVSCHITDNNNGARMFGIDLSIYKEKQLGQVLTESCRIVCMFDETSSRWKSYNLPAVARVLHVTGNIHGFYKAATRLSLCMIITELSYVSAPSTAPVAFPATTSAGPSPSKSRLKMWPGLPTSPSASKKRRVVTPEPESSSSTTLPGPRQSESPTPAVLGQMQAAAEEAALENRPKRKKKAT